mgnify:CR=1 FL=1
MRRHEKSPPSSLPSKTTVNPFARLGVCRLCHEGIPPQQAAAKTMTTATPDDTSKDFDASFAEFSTQQATPQEPEPAVAAEAAAAPNPPEPAEASAGSSEVERLKADLAEALHRERSASNRISSRDRENAALQARVRELEQEVQQLHSRAQAPAPSAADDAEDDVLSTAEDLRKAVERRVQKAVEPLQRIATDADARARAAEAKAAEAAQVVTPIIQRDAEQAEAELTGRLGDEFGGWDNAVKDVKFKAWLAKKPDAIRTLYNQGTTFDECATVLNLFSAETGHKFERRKQATQDSAPGASLRLQAGIRPGVGVVTPRPNPDDFDGAFAEFANRKQA